MDRLDVFAPILSKSRDDNGVLYVEGKVTGPDLDADQQRMDPDWLKSAVPAWAKVGNVREQHDSKRAVGKAVEVWPTDDGSWHMRAKIVDDAAAKKVDEGIYTGFSIGVRDYGLTKSETAPNGLITRGTIVETSLVDRPALASCKLTIAKAEGATELQPVDQAEVLTAPGEVDKAANPAEAAAIKAQIAAAKTPAEKAAATTRAKAAGLSNLIPASWGSDTPAAPAAKADGDMAELIEKAVTAALEKAAKPEVLEKTDEPEMLAKADAPELLKSLLAEQLPTLIADAVTKAVEPLQTGLAEVTSKVNDLPAPGGPVITRTAQQAATANQADQAVELLRKADTCNDPALAEGYRQRARALSA